MTDIVVTITEEAPVVVNMDEGGSVTAGVIRDRLEAATPTPVALVTATPVTVATWLVDSYGSRFGELVLTKSDGSRIVRRVTVRHDGTTSADATATAVAAIGDGTHADITGADWLDAVLAGGAASQTVSLQVTAAANGASWTATFVPSFLKAA